MRIFAAATLLWALFSLSARSADINLVFRHGEPIQDPMVAWEGRIEFASWIDDEFIVYLSLGEVTCISTKSGVVQWRIQDVGRALDWSISREAKYLAILARNHTLSVFDCTNGKTVFTADRNRMVQIFGRDFALISRMAIVPNDGRLVLCTFSSCYGRNGYILDPSFTKIASSFDVDASPRVLSVSPNGGRVAVIADKDVLCVRDLRENRDVYFRGTRINEEPASMTFMIDAPFYSHLLDSGGDHLVYTLDNSWGKGKVFVQDLKTRKEHSFDGHNGHIEMDVSFPTKRIALTGTSTDLTVTDFDGNVIAHKKNATTHRNLCAEFSPSADRILVGSGDKSLYVFSITGEKK